MDFRDEMEEGLWRDIYGRLGGTSNHAAQEADKGVRELRKRGGKLRKTQADKMLWGRILTLQLCRWVIVFEPLEGDKDQRIIARKGKKERIFTDFSDVNLSDSLDDRASDFFLGILEEERKDFIAQRRKERNAAGGSE